MFIYHYVCLGLVGGVRIWQLDSPVLVEDSRTISFLSCPISVLIIMISIIGINLEKKEK